MITSYKLFFTPMCPKCPSIKEFMKTIKIEGQLVDATTSEGLDEARKYKVASVPTVLFLDDEENIVAQAHSLDEIKRIVQNKSLIDV